MSCSARSAAKRGSWAGKPDRGGRLQPAPPVVAAEHPERSCRRRSWLRWGFLPGPHADTEHVLEACPHVTDLHVRVDGVQRLADHRHDDGDLVGDAVVNSPARGDVYRQTVAVDGVQQDISHVHASPPTASFNTRHTLPSSYRSDGLRRVSSVATVICPNTSGSLVINGVELESDCWVITSALIPLWLPNNYIEPSPVHIPGADGDIWYPSDIGTSSYDLQMVIIGDCDPTGTPYSDAWEGIEENIAAFYTDVLAPISSNRGLQAATLVKPSGAELTADVFVGPWQPGTTTEGTFRSHCSGAVGPSVHHRGVLNIKVPSGKFA